MSEAAHEGAHALSSLPQRKRRLRAILKVAALIAAGWALSASGFVVDVTDFALVTRFGEIRRAIETPGLYWKAPFDRVERLERRLMSLPLTKAEYLSLDKKNIVVESLLAWQIGDPLHYRRSLATRAAAEMRLQDASLAEIGAVIGRYPASALVSTDQGAGQYGSIVTEIRERLARLAQADYGIKILDVDILRLSLPDQNREHVFDRMKAERGKIAMEYRSAGALAGKEIVAQADREISNIHWQGYAEAQRLRAQGDAEASRIYLEAFARDTRFYKFLRTLQAYAKILDESTTLFLPAKAEVFEMLRAPDRQEATSRARSKPDAAGEQVKQAPRPERGDTTAAQSAASTRTSALP